MTVAPSSHIQNFIDGEFRVARRDRFFPDANPSGCRDVMVSA